MRWIIPAVLLLVATPPLRAADDFFSRDKALHFGFSTAIAFGLGVAFSEADEMDIREPLVPAFSITLSLGLVKEIRDSFKPGNHFCWMDLFWDAAGAGAGTGFAYLMERP